VDPIITDIGQDLWIVALEGLFAGFASALTMLIMTRGLMSSLTKATLTAYRGSEQ